MNVLKTDFISKQKRLQGQRQKIRRTFLPGYHTISNLVPSSSCFKLPITNKNRKSSPKFLISFSTSEESVVPISVDTYSTSENGVSERPFSRHRGESTTSTSVEFQKLLEPFLSFRQETDSNEEQFERIPTFSNLDVSHINVHHSSGGEAHTVVLSSTANFNGSFKLTNEKHLNSVFLTEDGSETENEIGQKSPEPVIQHLMNFSKEAFERYNIFDLPVPKNQKSIEEVLSDGKIIQQSVSEEVIRSPINKTRNSSDFKTPKGKLKKSPRVSGSSKTMTSDSGAFIIAVTEGRGHARGEVGIAAMDPKRPHLVLCQISDSQRYVHSLAKMNVFDFVEVIVPNTFVDCSTPNKLYSDIRAAFPKVTMTSVQRRHFNESIGVDLIRQFCSSESTSVMILLRDKFYALSAAAALIKYIEFTQNVRLAPHSLKVEYQGMEDTMIIDLNTANLLELVLCLNHPETNLNHSLMGVIKYCNTKGGVRLLRANILQPPCSLAKIEARLDCVSELVNNPLLLCALEAAVSSFSNVENLLNLCMHAPQQDGIQIAEYQLKYTLLLKTMLELLPTLRASLREAKSQFFCEVQENLEDPRYSMILNRILETVFENAKTVKGSVAAHLHGCFAIKAGINSLLDIAKKTYCEIVQEISDHVTKLRETHNMSLRLAFSANKGFHIQCTLPPGQKSENSLPKEFILVQKSKSTFTFYTTELVALDKRSQHVLNEIKLMTNVILFELLTDIRRYIGCLFNLCEYISELDLLISFAHVGSGTNYVRPKFGASLDLKDSRHPILDVIYDGEVVPNDVFAMPGKNFTILTGPNQSGKSIYIRQIALLQIMAQIGCYVPAKEATFRLTDRIFSRIGFDDSIESNASTLIVEMKDIEYLKQNKTPRSLVIIDELCRGTSVDEGTSLAFAICEELLDTSAFVFFTTHYLFLTKLEDMYFNVINYHFESKVEATAERKPSIQFTHLRKPGATTADSYGLQVAELTSFPKSVYLKAKEISEKLSKKRKPSRVVSGLLAEYELSLQLKNELARIESEANWEKVKFVIQNFQRMYLSLNREVSNDVEEENDAIMWEDQRSGNARNKKEKLNKEVVLRLANCIRKKYKKLRQKKIRV